ncbi:MAG: GTP cyclohydrolase II RibA, partial [Planctomycetes bacterium]|nr:GTP cyclohydrolase II RibA [Planctomycetota bacterium]
LEHHIKKELYRLKRYDGTGSLVALGLDDLEEINKNYGQRTGDLVVVHLSYILGSSTRATDIVGRFGGSEFLLYFPETPQEMAVKTMKKLQTRLKKAEVANIKTKLTFSAGIVEASRHGEDFKELYDNARSALEKAEKAGKGVVIYLRQEGRGIGLMAKLHAYRLQDVGMNTVQANEWLGYKADTRDYGLGAQICRDLGLSKIANMTNNPIKTNRLQVFGITVVEQIPLEIKANEHNRFYLKTKRDKMGHILKEL